MGSLTMQRCDVPVTTVSATSSRSPCGWCLAAGAVRGAAGGRGAGGARGTRRAGGARCPPTPSHWSSGAVSTRLVHVPVVCLLGVSSPLVPSYGCCE